MLADTFDVLLHISFKGLRTYITLPSALKRHQRRIHFIELLFGPTYMEMQTTPS